MNYLKHSFFIMMAFALIISCNSGEKQAIEQSSEFYAEIMHADGGDFLNISIGESYESVKAKLPIETFDDKSDGFIYSSVLTDHYEYYLDFLFDNQNQLYYISGQLYFFGENQSTSAVEATAFYKSFKNDLIEKFGNPIEESEDFAPSAFFKTLLLNAEIGTVDSEVYWFISKNKENLPAL